MGMQTVTDTHNVPTYAHNADNPMFVNILLHVITKYRHTETVVAYELQLVVILVHHKGASTI